MEISSHYWHELGHLVVAWLISDLMVIGSFLLFSWLFGFHIAIN